MFLRNNSVYAINKAFGKMNARIQELEAKLAAAPKEEPVKQEEAPASFDWKTSEDHDALIAYATELGEKCDKRSSIETVRNKIESKLGA